MPRILIVDDEPINQRMLSYSLRKAGYTVSVAVNGQAALDMIQTSEVDLVILDISMPVMDGISLLRLIRKDPVSEKLPVIILTASGDEEEIAVAEQIGVSGFLTKPSSSRLMLETVLLALEKPTSSDTGQ